MMSRANLERFFYGLTARPLLCVILGVCLIAITGAGLLRLVKDTSVDAFVPPGHPALQANDMTKALFGLSDPIAVAVFSKTDSSVFTPRMLGIVSDLTTDIQALTNVREDRVASITTEASIIGADGAINVDDYFDPDYASAAAIADSAQRWERMPPHVNTLVSADARGAVIMAELENSDLSAETYAEVKALAAEYAAEDIEILVAGPAAVSGYLSAYIDADARVLQPVVFLIVLTFLYLAFMRGSALLGPIVVLLGAAGGALGIMAWQGVPYFAITNALPVILVAISVADAIHILSAYFERRARLPEHPIRDVIVDAMVVMARPITLTTVTTMAGFFGIAVMSIMPPIAYFAWYAMLGVFLAWLFSLFVLPGVLVLVKPKPSPLFAAWGTSAPDVVGAWLGNISHFAARHPRSVLVTAGVVLAVAVIGAAQLRVDRSQVDNFAKDEPIRIADERIHEAFAGTAFLDVIVHSDGGDLLEQGRMHKIADLQQFLEQQSHVSKTVSIVDYLTLLHAAVNETAPGPARELPAEDMALAQYLMVYEASGDPTDFEEEITPDYQSALVRGVLDSHYFSDSREVVEALQTYLEDDFNEPGLHAYIAGDVNVAYHWMSDLQASHFAGVGLSLLLILGVSMLVFRSVGVGLIAVIPVSVTVLCIYGVMGYLDIHLEPATSMFAAISVGVGVDFAIHLVDRLQTELKQSADDDFARVVIRVVPSTARACFFNAAALGVGFSVLLISDLPTLQRFGGLVTVASLAAFIAALILVPACYALLEGLRRRTVKLSLPATSGSIALFCVALLGAPGEAQATTGLAIAEKVAARVEAEAVTKTIDMQLTNKRGHTRQRQAVVFRHNEGELKHTRITYLAPKPVRELTFLSRDFQNPDRADERWLYLPAARKVRRIPASDRGDYFLGTDFTYEDVQSDLKFEVTDYEFEYAGETEFEGEVVHRIKGRPKTAALARQLGHGGFTALIEARSWFPRQIVFVTTKQQPLKTIVVDTLGQIDGIWTAERITAKHHRTGHTTVFDYTDIKHDEALPEALFVSGQLTRGLPEKW